jgi:hypothetical protein
MSIFVESLNQMAAKKFVISWIASAVVMFLLFYLWHGLLLNDLRMLSYPLGLFLLFASVVYLIAGAVVSKAYSIEVFSRITKHPFLRGLLSGSVCGLLFYIIALVVGISFSKNITMQYMLIDISWQMIEQAIGGFIVGLVHIFVWDDSMIRPEDMD